MKIMFKTICQIALFFICSIANAEVYLGIMPGSNLVSIQAEFPNATFVDMKPAWAPKNIKVFQMQGNWLGGLVIIKLIDIRPILKKSMNLESSASGVDNEYFVASGFRFIPDEPLKLDALIDKYGQPDKTGVDNNYKKFVSWLNYGVSATLIDEKDDYVSMIEYAYTKEELDISSNQPMQK